MSDQNIHNEKILILDFGSQVTQLIARRVREIGVYCELWPWDSSEEQIKAFAPNGIILSGGAESVTASGSPRAPEYVFRAGVPVLGICYGLQTMAEQLGGKVESSDKREFGYALVDLDPAENPLFAGLSDQETDGVKQLEVWMSHGDRVSVLPEGFQVSAHTETCPYAAIVDNSRRFYGVQFHPEVTHTRKGREILTNFVKGICGLTGLWKPDAIIEDAVRKIRETVGSEKVILGLSGGVDSSVTALLLHKAIAISLPACLWITASCA